MTKEELLAKIQEICPEAFISDAENGADEIFIATGFVEPEEGAELITIDEHTEEARVFTKPIVHYFSDDGNYGMADGLVIIETSSWNDSDWVEIEETSDENRPKAAEIISNKYKKKK